MSVERAARPCICPSDDTLRGDCPRHGMALPKRPPRVEIGRCPHGALRGFCTAGC